MEVELVIQVVALLLGGGLVGGGSAYASQSKIAGSFGELRNSLDRLEDMLTDRLDRIESELKDATDERHDLKVEVELLKQRIREE